jgi:hypothetical protein
LKRAPILTLLFLAVICAGGCYTILSHPGLETDLTTESGEMKDCADCHADADSYHSPGYDSGWYSYYPESWAQYYSSPWWYDDFWKRPGRHYDNSVPAPPVEDNGRHVWSRGSGGGTSVLPSVVVPNPSQRADSVRQAAAPPTQPAQDQKPKEVKKEKEKDQRHVWGR